MDTHRIYEFRYQPELAETVIYWSLTFVLFFLSMIGLMEEQGFINMFSLTTFLLFLFFTILGTRRKIILTRDQIKVNAILKRNRYTINLSDIKNVLVGKFGLTLITPNGRYSYLMLKKSKNKLKSCLELEHQFTGKINEEKKGVDN